MIHDAMYFYRSLVERYGEPLDMFKVLHEHDIMLILKRIDDPGFRGITIKRRRGTRIVVNVGMSRLEVLSTVAHELYHACCHVERLNGDPLAPVKPCPRIEAEIFASLVMAPLVELKKVNAA